MADLPAMTSSISAYNTSQDIWTPMPSHSLHPPAASLAGSSLRSESPMSPIQQLDQYQLERNPRYSTIGRPGRGLHHHLHTASNAR